MIRVQSQPFRPKKQKNLSLNPTFVTLSHLLPVLPSDPFPSSFRIITLYSLRISFMRATYLSFATSLFFSTLIISKIILYWPLLSLSSTSQHKQEHTHFLIITSNLLHCATCSVALCKCHILSRCSARRALPPALFTGGAVQMAVLGLSVSTWQVPSDGCLTITKDRSWR